MVRGGVLVSPKMTLQCGTTCGTRAHVQRVTSEPLNLRAQKAISVITKRGSKRHTLHRHMEGHSLRGACWNGEIPVMFTLADGDVTALQPPPPHFVRSAHPH